MAGILLAILANGVRFAAAEPIGTPADNLALGRPYTLSVTPAYRFCTTGTELAKLTDGKYADGGTLWTDPATAGWERTSPVFVQIDLGAVQSIGGASISTAAGAWGVRWPTAMDVLVSDDGNTYRYLGDLIDHDALRRGRPAPLDTSYTKHRFWTDTLQARGRYVCFVLSPVAHLFTDEVEVYRGAADLPNRDDAGISYPGPEAFLKATAVQRGIARRVHRDAQTLHALAATSPGSDARTSAQRLALSLQKATIYDLAPQPPADFRAVAPITVEHRALYRAFAALMRSAGRNAPWMRAVNPWEPVPHMQVPQAAEDRLAVRLMQNEFRAAAVNVTNPLDEDVDFQLRVEGLPGGGLPPYLSVFAVPFVDSWSGEMTASALVPANRAGRGWTIPVPSGMTCQVWLRFHPQDLPAGGYGGTLVLDSSAGVLRCAVQMRVSALSLPQPGTLGLGAFEYTDLDSSNAVTAGNRDAFIALCREYGVDSPWATRQVLTEGVYDKTLGVMTMPPDTRRFDAWVRAWAGARRYCIFVNAGEQFQGIHMERPQFSVAVAQWARFWAGHARKQGIDPQAVYLLLVDEPATPAQDKIAIAWARAIRSADTGLQIWTDPQHTDPALAVPEFYALADVICANRQMLFSAGREKFRAMAERPLRMGQRLELYSAAGPARSLDPYAYYRLQAWECWRLGAMAQHFWSFGDSGGASSWNEYAATRVPYTPLFADTTSVTASKQMEAIREGVQDFEYLHMLRQSIAGFEARDEITPKVLEANDLLNHAVLRVLAQPGSRGLLWRDPRDRHTAETVRLEILDMLLSLQGGPELP